MPNPNQPQASLSPVLVVSGKLKETVAYLEVKEIFTVVAFQPMTSASILYPQFTHMIFIIYTPVYTYILENSF